METIILVSCNGGRRGDESSVALMQRVLGEEATRQLIQEAHEFALTFKLKRWAMSSKLFPDLPDEYQDRCATPSQIEAYYATKSSPTEQPIEGPKPIAVTLDAQEIGVMYGTKISPYEFRQFLLAKLKDAGAAVEGALHLRLAHGEVYKIKSAPGDMVFQYIWLPETYVAGLSTASGLTV